MKKENKVKLKYDYLRRNRFTDYDIPEEYKKYLTNQDVDNDYRIRNEGIYDIPAYAYSFVFENGVMARVLKSGETIGHKDDLWQCDVFDYRNPVRPIFLEVFTKLYDKEITCCLAYASQMRLLERMPHDRKRV